jgi:putative salt-induced outer membrane protein YdiY
VDLRSIFGGGYGLQIVEDERSSLSLRGGIDYITVERIAGANEDYPAFGWGLRAAHRLGQSQVELFHDQDGFLQLTDGSGVILRSRTGLRAPVAGRLNASLQLNVDWEENPAPGRKSTDSRLLVGLGYAW